METSKEEEASSENQGNKKEKEKIKENLEDEAAKTNSSNSSEFEENEEIKSFENSSKNEGIYENHESNLKQIEDDLNTIKKKEKAMKKKGLFIEDPEDECRSYNPYMNPSFFPPINQGYGPMNYTPFYDPLKTHCFEQQMYNPYMLQENIKASTSYFPHQRYNPQPPVPCASDKEQMKKILVLKEKNESKKREISELKAKLKALMKSTSVRESCELSKRIEKYQSKCEKMEKERELLVSEIKKRDESLKSSKEEILHQTELIEKRKRELKDMKAQIGAKEQEIINLNNTLQGEISKTQTFQRKNHAALLEFNNLKEDFDNMAQHLAKYKKENEKILNQLENIKEENFLLKRENEQLASKIEADNSKAEYYNELAVETKKKEKKHKA